MSWFQLSCFMPYLIRVLHKYYDYNNNDNYGQEIDFYFVCDFGLNNNNKKNIFSMSVITKNDKIRNPNNII